MGTEIQWTDETWNPVTGCTKVSPGCANCYAETVANRFWAKQYQAVKYTDQAGSTDARPRRFTDVQWHPDRLAQPLGWRKPRKTFVNSMSDLFHEDVPDAFIDQVFAVMALCPQHTFQVLTKRHNRMFDYVTSRARSSQHWKDAARVVGYSLDFEGVSLVPFPLPNVWLGVSVENQHFADERIPRLLQTPAAVRFISAEPLLAPVDLSRLPSWLSGQQLDALTGSAYASDDDVWLGRSDRPSLDWVIVGGESGAGSRTFDLEWGRQILGQCQAAGVPCFIKQLGSAPRFSRDESVKFIRNSKGGDMAEWPDDLRVRQFPEVA